MVKEEEDEDVGQTPVLKLGSETFPNVESSHLESLSSSCLFHVKEEILPSSSSSHLKSNFVGMGFSPKLVDKVIEENGEEDFNLLLDLLFTQSALETSDLERLDSRDGSQAFYDQDSDSSFELSSGGTEEIEKEGKPGELHSDKKYSLLKMKFSMRDIDLAINRLGKNASLPELIDFIIAAQIAGNSQANFCKTELITTETLFTTMDRTLQLLQMGFTEEEISAVIDKFGLNAPVSELADSIFANRIAHDCLPEDKDHSTSWNNHKFQNQNKSVYSGCATGQIKREFSMTDFEESKASCSNPFEWDSKEYIKGKKSKHISMNDKAFSSDNHGLKRRMSEQEARFRGMTTPPIKPEFEAERIFREPACGKRAQDTNSVSQCPSKPPYFFFGSVVDLSLETWGKLSRFLYGVEPEFVNSQFFSALIRKEGYLHNVPTEDRSHIFPKPPMTIEEALPHTKKWWPSWDTRKQLSCISSDTTGVACGCERVGRMMMHSRGILSKEQQIDILHQCKTMNLLWVGENKLSPIEPDHVDRILGYPVDHTRISELKDEGRLRALKFSFQTDTLGYHLSSLKWMFPDGLRILSIFSGIGGAEIALSRLGIWLQCVVSVEASEINRKILRKWWQASGQTGELRQIEGIRELSGHKIDSMIREFGGFDLIIAGNPPSYTSGTSQGDSSAEIDFPHFLEFVRVFQRIRGVMARN